MGDYTDPSLPIDASGRTVGDFWQWAFSDLISNDTRGAFAEFLVGSALGCLSEPRLSWDAVDLRYRGVGVEVKSSARWQSWPQERPSQPSFGIAPSQAWDAKTNTYESEPARSADIYVFAYFDPYPAVLDELLTPSIWEFYVVATSVLDAMSPTQGTITLSRLRQIADPTQYFDLAAKIDRLAGTNTAL